MIYEPLSEITKTIWGSRAMTQGIYLVEGTYTPWVLRQEGT